MCVHVCLLCLYMIVYVTLIIGSSITYVLGLLLLFVCVLLCLFSRLGLRVPTPLLELDDLRARLNCKALHIV